MNSLATYAVRSAMKASQLEHFIEKESYLSVRVDDVLFIASKDDAQEFCDHVPGEESDSRS